MERHVHESFTIDSLDEVLGLYGGLKESLTKLTESESFVCEFLSQGTPRILRVTPESHRTQQQIQAELDWIAYLRSHQVHAAASVEDGDGQRIHQIPGNGISFHAVVFEKAPGRSPRLADWTPSFIRQWGEFTGRMHKLASVAGQCGVSPERPVWNQEYNVTTVDVLAHQPEVLQQHQTYMDYLRSLPRQTDGYGIIHSDFETENFFLDASGITAFDFDECQYHWFVYDIASIVRQASWTVSQIPVPLTLQQFYHIFMEGYHTQFTLNDFWVQQMPRFVQWREICMYVFVHGKQDPSTWSAETQSYFETVRRRIAQDQLPFTIDYR